MWLKEKVYILSAESVDNFQDNIGNINVRLNDKLTTIEISQLFAKITYGLSILNGTIKICGWSILQNIKDGVIKIGDNDIAVSFETESGLKLYIKEVKSPWIIFNDIELNDEELNSINQKLLELASVQDLETEREEEPHSPPPVFNNEDYLISKNHFIKKGFEEYINGNNKLLIKDSGNEVKGYFIQILSDNELIQLKNPRKVIPGFYKFDDVDNNRIVNVKIQEDKTINVDFSNLEVVEEEKVDV